MTDPNPEKLKQDFSNLLASLTQLATNLLNFKIETDTKESLKLSLETQIHLAMKIKQVSNFVLNAVNTINNSSDDEQRQRNLKYMKNNVDIIWRSLTNDSVLFLHKELDIWNYRDFESLVIKNVEKHLY